MKVTGYENPIKIIGGLINALTFVLLGFLLATSIYFIIALRDAEAAAERRHDQLLKEAQLQTAWAAQCKAIQEK